MKTLNGFLLIIIISVFVPGLFIGKAEAADYSYSKRNDILGQSDEEFAREVQEIEDAFKRKVKQDQKDERLVKSDDLLEDLEHATKPAAEQEDVSITTPGSSQRYDESLYLDEAPSHWLDEHVLNKDAHIENVSRELVIDKAFKEAKSVDFLDAKELKEVKPKKVEKPVEASFETQTDQQIIEGLIKPEHKNKKVDLDFNGATLNDLFMTLGTSGEINIMLDPALKNLTIDVHLKQVTLKEAFILIASAHNLGFQRIENSVFVTNKEKLKEQSLASKVITLRNIKADEAKMMVSDLIKTVNVGHEINSLIVIGQPSEIAKVENVIKTIDRPQPQVVLEAKIVEVNRDALKDLGVDWSDSITMDFQESGRPLDIPDTADATKSFLKLGAMERSPIAFSAIINMLESHNKAKVLSSPRVTTMNDKEAEIFVGDRIPYTITTTASGVSTTEVRFEEPGIRLKITPSIIDDDFVVIKVEPEVSYIFSFRGPDNQYPWIKKRLTTAYVRVRNNKPFILGGILNQEDKKNLYKVPMLGNIPMLGNLFSYEKSTVQDTELIISVTPTIVQGDM